MWCWWLSGCRVHKECGVAVLRVFTLPCSSGCVGWYLRNVVLVVEWLCRVVLKECGVGGRVAVGYIRNVELVVEWLCRVHKG